MKVWDAVILGAGAAGLFCASRLAQRGLQVCVLEHNTAPGKKIRISGGGRCNFTNIHTTHRCFASSNPDYARSALARYTPQDFIALVESYGIAWHEKTLGQLFCDGSAQQIIDMLVAECRSAGVTIHLGVAVQSVRKPDGFVVQTSSGEVHAHRVVVAAGGLSIPSLGATGLGYQIARQFGHRVIEPEPALVPLVFNEQWQQSWGSLAGVSVAVEAHADGPAFREQMLFTHRGLTGPAVLQASTYWHDHGSVAIDLLPELPDAEAWYQLHRSDRRIVRNILADHLPRRLAQHIADPRLDAPVGDQKKADVLDVLHTLKQWLVVPSGTEGFAKAEVTRGGVDTTELSSKTMESKHVPGLYFIGEVVDITGWLGGYNFQWAWASAAAVAG